MELFKSRTRVAYTNDVGDKVYPVVVDIKKGIKSTEDIQFVSSDVNTGILSVAFISGNENFNVSGADVVCSVMRPDASTLELPCEVVRENIVEVPLGINGTSQDGVYSFDFKVLKGGNKIVGTPIMNYSVSLSIGNGMVVEEDDRLPVLTMLITQVNELKEETRETVNQANVATEASREATANAIEATNNANAVSERVSQETATAISEIRQDTENAISTMNQSTSTAISTMNQNTANAIANVNATSDTMVENVNNAISSMDTTVNSKISEMTDVVNNKISEVDIAKNEMINDVSSTKANMVNEVTNAKNEMTTTVSNKVNEVETRFNALTASQQQSSEVIDARDGETSLKARLDRDIEKAKQVYTSVEGNCISTDSSSGYAKDVEILGNTIQDASNLADIRSVGDKVEGQELYEIPVLSVGKNLVDNSKHYIIDMGHSTQRYVTINNGGHTSSSAIFYLKQGTYSFAIEGFNLSKVVDGGILVWKKDKLYSNTRRVAISKPFSIEDDEIGITFYFATETMQETLLLHNKPFMIEEGTQATPYEPYIEDKLTILSPVQLEKVGDVRDRIIEKDGVWGVEKNIGAVVFNGSESITHIETRTNTTTFNIPYNMQVKDSALVSNLFNWEHTYNDYEHIYSLFDSVFRVLISNDKANNIDDFKQYLSSNNLEVKYICKMPQFIPLPHDQQIKLRTFANKTNISFLTEIEGTIKAQVPKSIGATVNTHTEQIRSLNNELNRVKKLEESTVSTVTTESDFTTVEATSNGYFEDVKLEGKTLVNLCKTPNKVLTNTKEGRNLHFNASMFKYDTDYTAIFEVGSVVDGTSTLHIQWRDVNGGNRFNIIDNVVSNIAGKHIVYKFKQTQIDTPLREVFLSINTANPSTCTCEIKNMVVLEGDHTQNPPSYFEGLKSVGQSATTSEDDVDEIVVLSTNNGNLAYNAVIEVGNLLANGSNGTRTDRERVKGFIEVEPNTSINISYNKAMNVYEYDSNYDLIKVALVSGPLKLSQNTKFIRFYAEIGALTNIIVSYTSDFKNQPHKQDKKRLLYYNNETQAWEKPILRQWDSIEKHADGKYYYHQRSGEAVLTGNEFWELRVESDSQNVISFNGSGLITSSDSLGVVCDKFPTMKAFGEGSDFENIFIATSTRMQVRILKSKLSTQDVQGFKQWLQANNVTVVYQLAQEKVYECTNIDLITYANETNYIVNCGAIVPRTTLKVHNNISNVVSLLQKKVSLLEDKFIQGLKQVLAGDMYSLAELLYPEDFVEENPENNIMLLPFE